MSERGKTEHIGEILDRAMREAEAKSRANGTLSDKAPTWDEVKAKKGAT